MKNIQDIAKELAKLTIETMSAEDLRELDALIPDLNAKPKGKANVKTNS